MIIFERPDLIIDMEHVGALQTNCFFIINPKKETVVIVDPGDDGDFLSEKIVSTGLNPTNILLTHGHFDHGGGTLPLRLNFPELSLIVPKKDLNLYKNAAKSASYFGVAIDPQAPPTHLVEIRKGQPQFTTINNGADLENFLPDWQWLDTPGHTPGGISLFHPKHRLLIAGDNIFNFGQIGRTDFKYSDSAKLASSIRTKLLTLPDNTIVFPGHEEIFNLDIQNKKYLEAAISLMG
ncbi:MAG: MBL fold metallo-hydrolase [Pseudomonadales bacterium]|jgi:glyoxylase-like metal-dependent hydrolase (beta-lactamase superfamily II)|nr:MBL fold metallo-hydrolase [Pseudomonadales bacterium]